MLEREAQKIRRDRALPWPSAPLGEGDTVWMGCIDRYGFAVSYIQSLYWEWGSGCVLPTTGVLWQNRGVGFSLDPMARNPLEPGRFPLHTLSPGMARLKDGRLISYGTMGGDGQPQTLGATFVRYAGYDLPIDEAISRPRWRLGRTWGAEDTTLKLESRFDGALIERLAAMGHEVEVLERPFSSEVGHAGMVVLHPSGRIEGVHDPRGDGGALGL